MAGANVLTNCMHKMRNRLAKRISDAVHVSSATSLSAINSGDKMLSSEKWPFDAELFRFLWYEKVKMRHSRLPPPSRCTVARKELVRVRCAEMKMKLKICQTRRAASAPNDGHTLFRQHRGVTVHSFFIIFVLSIVSHFDSPLPVAHTHTD